MFGEKIINFGNHFIGRLEKSYLDGALDYVNHNEEPLAVDTLCEHLVEYNISITQVEYEEGINLINEMGLSELEPPYKYLKELIKY